MAAQTWQIDKAHSDIHFTVRHMVITKVRGRFLKWDGTLALDEQDWSKSRVDIAIDAASISTNDEKRDGHLKSADFLDAEKFPKVTFKSTKIAPAGGDKLNVTGDLTIRDVTKPVTIAVERLGKAKDPWGNNKIAFNGKLTIERDEFGAKWNQVLETGGVLVGKEVEIDLELQAIAPSA
ncbi:MAG TPA: YceI family protein [Polyangia bacterium]|nr:YceI family protein [Polyangia bacterium]